MTVNNNRPKFDIKDKLVGVIISCLLGIQAAMWTDIRSSRDDIKILIAQSSYAKAEYESMRKDVDDLKKKMYGQNTSSNYNPIAMKREEEYVFKRPGKDNNNN